MSVDGVKNAVYGLAVGTFTAFAGDSLYGLTIAPMLKTTSGSNATQLGAAVVQSLVAGTSGALILFGGQRMFETVVTQDDFVATVMFYHTAYSQSSTIHSAVKSMRSVLTTLIAIRPTGSPPPTTKGPGGIHGGGDVVAPAPGNPQLHDVDYLQEMTAVKYGRTGCGKSACGSLFK